ncbi:alpha-actinin-2-associated lim protein/alp, putative [Pediculus humanus corporis]|uniref:Alpha-actinin-2-associated lim protein/alp, putative n=1 Tax=Pediculus humanus subsp. corporis TaxID=121224 RepID=E0VI60_PEDHC|nr:alpha-actinin-2-associated lim protein/alp, putative [Pediculus humanus corporis]EEB13066.1 alpha-actinin-2-associated lim protein/alp, putative [Pediculus humanus corporis]
MSAREIILDGGSPWGFRIHGGCDLGMPIKISRVNPGSKAALKGIREGDIISSINGTSTKNIRNRGAHSLLRNAGEQLRLSLNEDGLSSPRRKMKQTTVTTVFTEEPMCPSRCTGDVDSNKDFQLENEKERKKRGDVKINGGTKKKKSNRLREVIKTLKFLAFGRGGTKKEGATRGRCQKNVDAKSFRKTRGIKKNRDEEKTKGNLEDCKNLKTVVVVRDLKRSPKNYGIRGREKKIPRENGKKSPPEKPKRNNWKKLESDRKSPVFGVVRKTVGKTSPVVSYRNRNSPLKSRKFKSGKRLNNFFLNETSFLSSIAEESSPPSGSETVTTTRTIHVRKYEDKGENNVTEKVQAQIHAEESNKQTREIKQNEKENGDFLSGINDRDPCIKKEKKLAFEATKIKKVEEESVENDGAENSGEMITTMEKTSNQTKENENLNDGKTNSNDGLGSEKEENVGDGKEKEKLSEKKDEKSTVEVGKNNSETKDSEKIKRTSSSSSSPVHSPNLNRKHFETDAVMTTFYTYPSVSYAGNLVQQVIIEEGSSEESQEQCPTRKLDVILEESSDLSDASDKKTKMTTGGMNAHLHVSERGPYKIYPLKEESSDVSDATFDDSTDFQTTNKGNVLKMNGGESKSEDSYEISQTETSFEISEDPSYPEPVTTYYKGAVEKEEKRIGEGFYTIKKCPNSYKYYEEESESWRSSIEPETTCNESDADVESELDSQRTPSTNEWNNKFKTSRKFYSENFNEDLKNFIKTDTLSSDPSNICGPIYENVSIVIDKNKTKDESLLSSVTSNDNFLASYDSTGNENFLRKRFENNGNKIQNNLLKHRIEAIKNDMEKILLSKAKVIDSRDEINLDRNSWTSLLNTTEKQLNESRGVPLKNFTGFVDDGEKSDVTTVKNDDNNVIIINNSCSFSQNPEALSNLAEKKILTLPYGKLILRKIGLGKCCSNNCRNSRGDVEEDMYVKSKRHLNELSDHPSDASVRSLPTSLINRDSINEDERDLSFVEFDYADARIGQIEKWYGARTMVPALFLGLSPSQKKAYEEKVNKFMTEEVEAASLLDLHQKFLQRRSYDETNSLTRKKNTCYDSKTKDNSIILTHIGKPGGMFGKTEMELKKNEKIWDGRMKEKKMADKEINLLMQSCKESGQSPDGNENFVVENCENLNVSDHVLKSVARNDDRDLFSSVKKMNAKSCDVKNEEKINEKSGGGEAVGKSCLLAILQNATSDTFVPELTLAESSVESASEINEDSSVRSQKSVINSWHSNPIFANKNTNDEKHENETDDLFEEGPGKSFERIWNKEKKISECGALGESPTRVAYRPKTICCEKETDVVSCVKEPIFEKKIAPLKNAPVPGKQSKPEEGSIVTENLPPVSDVIKSFEEPKSSTVKPNSSEDFARKKREIRIDNERYRISRKGDIAFLQNGDARFKNGKQQIARREKRKSMPASLLSEKEIFKQKMYNEYMSKLAERIERRQKKVIKVSQSNEFEFTDYWKGEISNLENEDLISYGDKIGFDNYKENGGNECSTNYKRNSVQLILDDTIDVDNLPKHLKELLLVEEDDFPELFYEIDENLILSKGFLFGRANGRTERERSRCFKQSS